MIDKDSGLGGFCCLRGSFLYRLIDSLIEFSNHFTQQFREGRLLDHQKRGLDKVTLDCLLSVSVMQVEILQAACATTKMTSNGD